MARIPTIDLFSGAGGLSLGLKKSNFHPVLAVEIDKYAVETYRKNFKGTEIYDQDIRSKSFKKYRGVVDLVAGGPPCQPFSVAGSQQSYKDPRDMIPEFIRAVREIKPKAFLLENVAGLTSLRHRQYLEMALAELRDLGYFIPTPRVLNAAEHGVPQFRRRLIIIGTKQDGFTYPEPSHGDAARRASISSWDAIKNAPEDEPNTAIITYAKNPVLRVSPFAGMLVNGGGRPIDLQKPSPTIPASAGGNRTHIVDANGVLLKYHSHLRNGGKAKSGLVEGVRRLTVRESACIQTFPAGFVFMGPRSAQYRQVGNAVPPKLAQSIGSKLHELLA